MGQKARKRHQNRDPKVTTSNTIDKIGNGIAGLALQMKRATDPHFTDFCEVQWGKEDGETFLEITYQELCPPQSSKIAPLGDVYLDAEEGISRFRVQTQQGLLSAQDKQGLLDHYAHVLRTAGKPVETNPAYKNAQIGLPTGQLSR